MSEDTTEIETKDIKKPKKLIKKLAKIGLLGLGAVSQEFLHAQLSEATNVNRVVLSGGEIILGGLATGSIKNKYAKSFLSGIVAGASKDLVSNLISGIKEGSLFQNLKLKLGGAAPADAEGPAPAPDNGKGDIYV